MRNIAAWLDGVCNMADNKRWFKVWTTLLIDKINEDISFAEIGIFTLLGCLIAQKGDNGNCIVSKRLFKTLFDDEKLPEKMMRIFNVKIGVNDNDTISVSLLNWHKYQKDSTGYERLKRWRNKQNETADDNGDKIRKDKIRKDKIRQYKKKKKTPFVSSDKIAFDSSSFRFINLNGKKDLFKEKYPAIDIDAEIRKIEGWLMANPKNKKSNYERFINNWLSRAQDKTSPGEVRRSWEV